MQRVHGPVSSDPINPPVWNGVLLVESPTVFSCCSLPWTTHCQPMPATEWTMWLINMTNYPLPYSRWFSVINRFRNCQVWLLVSTSKYFRDRRFQGKRSRNDESAWTNYLHVIPMCFDAQYRTAYPIYICLFQSGIERVVHEHGYPTKSNRHCSHFDIVFNYNRYPY